MILPSLKALIAAIGIHGYSCINTGDEPGWVRWYDGGAQVYAIIIPGVHGKLPRGPIMADNTLLPTGPRIDMSFLVPLRIKNPNFNIGKGIRCTLSFPMDAS